MCGMCLPWHMCEGQVCRNCFFYYVDPRDLRLSGLTANVLAPQATLLPCPLMFFFFVFFF